MPQTGQRNSLFKVLCGGGHNRKLFKNNFNFQCVADAAAAAATTGLVASSGKQAVMSA
jgi:hypothetical protein